MGVFYVLLIWLILSVSLIFFFSCLPLFAAKLFLTRSGAEPALLLRTSCFTSSHLLTLLSLCPSPPHPLHFGLRLSEFLFQALPLTFFISLFRLSFVSQLSPINLVYLSHRLPIEILLLLLHNRLFLLLSSSLLSPLSLFTPPFILYSWHRFLFSHTFIPTFLYIAPPPHPPPSPLAPPFLSSSHHQTVSRLIRPSILPSSQHTSSPLPFRPDSCAASQTNGGKYGNVSVTRRGIRERRVNTAGLSQCRRRRARVRVHTHIMWVLKT